MLVTSENEEGAGRMGCAFEFKQAVAPVTHLRCYIRLLTVLLLATALTSPL
jgi:hypothetical protein